MATNKESRIFYRKQYEYNDDELIVTRIVTEFLCRAQNKDGRKYCWGTDDEIDLQSKM